METFEIGKSHLIGLKDLKQIEIIYENGLIEAVVPQVFQFPNGIQVVSVDALAYITALIQRERNSFISKEKELNSLKIKNGRAISSTKRYKEEIEKLKNEIQGYKNTFGNYLSPFTILEELYRGISLPYMILKKRTNFKIKVSEKQFSYWIGIFIDLDIVRKIDKSNIQSLLNYQDAQNILYENKYTWKGEKQ